MQTAAHESNANPDRDLFFQCENCASPLVVDATAAGTAVLCLRCGKPTTVPQSQTSPARPAAAPDQAAELARHLKENASQRTEVNGYINQLSIQLHRWQLRLQTLEQRHQELTAKLTSLGGKS